MQIMFLFLLEGFHMNEALLKKLSTVTDEEKRILAGQKQIDRSLYMDGMHTAVLNSSCCGAERQSGGANGRIKIEAFS